MDKVLAQGRLLYAIAALGLGVETAMCATQKEVAFPSLPAVLVQPVIPWLPPVAWLGYLLGAMLVTCGAALVLNRGARGAASTLAAFFLVSVVVLELPRAALKPFDLNIRTGVFEPLALGAGALMLAAGPAPIAAARTIMLIGRMLLALSSIVFGITHFLVLAFIATLIPAWIPGKLFFAAFTGVGFETAGVAIATTWLGRVGAALLGLMFLLWFLIVHAPRVFAASGIHDPNEWSSMLIALGMCGASWICALTFAPARTGVTSQAAAAPG